MFAIGLLLLLVSYIFAVMFTQLFKTISVDGELEFDYFGRLDETFFTLFQVRVRESDASSRFEYGNKPLHSSETDIRAFPQLR